MKKVILLLLLAVTGVIGLPGCQSTSEITYYDADGKITKVEKATKAMVDQVVSSTKDKTVYVWQKGWMGKLNVASPTTENPVPGFDAELGNVDQGVLTIHKDQKGTENLPEIIKAANSSALSVGVTGISGSTGAGTATATGTSATTTAAASGRSDTK
ncbi:MAG: hypothetical protein PHQ27_02445 [Victivallales bacterium]|nr:hypothetical protein [Victivallales bacterium]